MYVTMKTKPISAPVKRPRNLQDKLQKLINHSLNTNAFSTFPYITQQLNSKQSIKNTQSGNCVALSLYLKLQLKKLYDIDSYLIPATVPSYIYKEGYLTICHVALLVPLSNTTYFLIDPAFYFMEPLKITTNRPIEPSKCMDIYNDTPKYVNAHLKSLDKRVQLNEYQGLPKNTLGCECAYTHNLEDTWTYYMREIMNPDQSISQFFIKIRKEPFFVSTRMVGDICKKELVIRTHSTNHISIKYMDDTIYDGPLFTIHPQIKKAVQELLSYRNFDKSILDLHF